MAKFTVYYKSGWRWLLVASNGEPVAQSEPYSSKYAAQAGAEAVKRIAGAATIQVVE